MIAVGDYHTCYLSAIGRISCWGWNQFGQTGIENGNETIKPGKWLDLQGIVQIAAGEYHTCAVNANHQVYCWGRNNMGQLGTGDTIDHSTPMLVGGLEEARIDRVVAGSVHTCAYEISGRAWCWGSNRDGKLGTGSSEQYAATPREVLAPVQNVVAMSAGATFTCATEGGKTWCWGDGSFGQIGLPGMKSSREPVEFSALSNPISQLSSGWFHTCALTPEGDIQCWGKNLEGELGNSSTVSRADPVPVSSLSGKKAVRLVSAGGQSTCVVSNDNRVLCWGKNDLGQLGNGTFMGSLFPIGVLTIEAAITGIAVGASHACYLTADNQVYCWGANDHFQMGNDAKLIFTQPLRILIPTLFMK